jgi:VanZ family protein
MVVDRTREWVAHRLRIEYRRVVRWSRHAVTVIALCLVGLGGLLEVLQAFTPDRDADYVDFLANSAGVVVGWLLGRTRLANTSAILEAALMRLIA